MSRIGKIARLPKVVRDELNERLLDGEPGNLLVEWLNGREEVRAVLAREMGPRTKDRGPGTKDCEHEHEYEHEHDGAKAKGRNPWITEQNLSEWRKGGFEDWRRQQESQELAGRMVDETSAVAEAMAGELTGSKSLTDRVAMMAALALGELLMAARRMEDGEEKRRVILKIVRALVRLRKSERDCERAQREAAQDQRAKEIHEHWAESVRRRSQPVEPAPKRIWWTEEDEALEGSDEIEPAMERRKAEADATNSPQAGLTSSAQAGATGLVAGGADDEWDDEDPPVQGAIVQDKIPQVGAQPANTSQRVASLGTHPGGPDAKTGQPVASLGTPGLRRAGGAPTPTGEEMDGCGNPRRSGEPAPPAREDPSESK